MEEAALTTAKRLRVALSLFESGVLLMRQNLRRRHPGASSDQIDVLVREWLAERPGAEHGDGVGTPRLLPENAG